MRLSESLAARAVTFGRHIAFHPDGFRPQEFEGQRLLRHEAFHAVQNLPEMSLSRADRSRASKQRKAGKLTSLDLDGLSACDLAWVQGKLGGADCDVGDELCQHAAQKLAADGHPEGIEANTETETGFFDEAYGIASTVAEHLLTSDSTPAGMDPQELDFDAPGGATPGTTTPVVDVQSVRAARAKITIDREAGLSFDPITGIYARQLSDYGFALAKDVSEVEALRTLLTKQESKIISIARILIDFEQLGVDYEPIQPFDLDAIAEQAAATGKTSAKQAQQDAAGAVARDLHRRAEGEETAAKATVTQAEQDAADYRKAGLEHCADEAEHRAEQAKLAQAISGYVAVQASSLRSYHIQVTDLERQIIAKQKSAETKVGWELKTWGQRERRLSATNPTSDARKAVDDAAQLLAAATAAVDATPGKATRNNLKDAEKDYDQKWGEYEKEWARSSPATSS